MAQEDSGVVKVRVSAHALPLSPSVSLSTDKRHQRMFRGGGFFFGVWFTVYTPPEVTLPRWLSVIRGSLST